MYRLINNKTKEETICNLVTINGFDYYVEDREPTASHALLDNCYYIFNNKLYKRKYSHHVDCKLVLCTNNSNIDIPKVIDEVNIIIKNAFYLCFITYYMYSTIYSYICSFGIYTIKCISTNSCDFFSSI